MADWIGHPRCPHMGAWRFVVIGGDVGANSTFMSSSRTAGNRNPPPPPADHL